MKKINGAEAMNHKLTDTDIRILSEIELKGTAPVKECCKALKMKEANFRYHLRKLYASNLLRLLPEIDFSALGYFRYRVLLSLSCEDGFSAEDMLVSLKPHVFAAKVVEISGEFSHAVSLIVESHSALKSALTALSRAFAGVVKEKRVIQIEDSCFLGRRYLLGKREPRQFVKNMPDLIQSDKKETGILNHLFNHPYRTRADIAKELTIAPSTIEYKIGKLEKLGVIKRWYIELNAQALGVQKHSLLLSLNSLDEEERDALTGTLTGFVNIVEIHKCLNSYDLSLTVETMTSREYLDIRAHILRPISGHLSSATSLQILGETDLFRLCRETHSNELRFAA